MFLSIAQTQLKKDFKGVRREPWGIVWTAFIPATAEEVSPPPLFLSRMPSPLLCTEGMLHGVSYRDRPCCQKLF